MIQVNNVQIEMVYSIEYMGVKVTLSGFVPDSAGNEISSIIHARNIYISPAHENMEPASKISTECIHGHSLEMLLEKLTEECFICKERLVDFGTL